MSVRNWRPASRRNPCPVCEKPDWCRTFDDGGTECMRVSSETETRNGGWMHWPGGRPDDWQERLAAQPDPEPRTVHDPDTLHAAYAALLSRCPLSDDHRQAMAGKGYDPGLIDRMGHGTLPAGAADRAAIVAWVEAATGIDLVGNVPGFRHGPVGATVAAAADCTGRLIPTRDRQGRVSAGRLRIDGATDNKYRWLSGFPGGANIDGSTVHWAMPDRDHGAGIVGVTEGEDKANIAAARMGFPVLSVAGITQQANVPDAVRESGARFVALYFDRDPNPETRARVEDAEARLARAIAEACPDVTVLQGVWPDEAGKGLDDCLLSGLVPFTRSHPALAATSEADRERMAHLEETAVVNLTRYREAREENRLVNRIVAKNDLGGDVGGSVALRLVNYAAAKATSEGLQPGDVIPLVASQIAREFWDPLAQRSHDAVSRQTVTKRVAGFVEKGIIPTVPETPYTYTAPNGITKQTMVPGLVWPEGGRLELLRLFDAGSVLAEGETRNRGGRRERRLPIVCPHCHDTDVSCRSCGSVFSSVMVAGDRHVTLSEHLPDQPALLEQAASGATGNQPAPTSPPSNDVPGVRYLDGVTDEGGDQPDPVEQADPDEEERRLQRAIRRADRKRREAQQLIDLMRHRGAVPHVTDRTLVYDEARLTEREQARIAEARREITELLLVEDELARMRAGNHPAPVEQGDPPPIAPPSEQAGFGRWTA